MARLARTVIPGTPHHVTQRGNRRLPIFFSDDDRRLYLALIRDGCERARVRCLGWCLMDNHVHLILVPETADGLRAALGEAHRRYTRAVNFREGWRGYLFQGRFASYAMDDAHLLAALRYVEHHPVAAGMVEQPADWPWSSARSHLAGRRAHGDKLTDLAALAGHVPNWRAYLRYGAEAGGLGAEGEAVAEAIEARLRTGRLLGADAWIVAQEAQLGRPLQPQRRGPKVEQQGGDGRAN